MNNDRFVYFIRVGLLSLLSFLIIGGYAIARPAIDSLFLSHYSPNMLPYAWVSMALVTAGTIGIYNRYNTRFSLLTLFGAASVFSSATLALLLICIQAKVPHSVFLLYVWKEVYIVLLVEIFWSFSDVVFSIEKARRVYGWLLAASSFGGLLGNFCVGYVAKSLGTVVTLWLLLPLILVCLAISAVISRFAGDRLPSSMKEKKTHWQDAFKVVWTSKYLMPLLLLVAVVQMSVTFIDFEVSTAMQRVFTDIDARTNAIGNLHAAIDVFALLLQATTSPILRSFGVAWVLLLIPCFVGSVVLGALIFPKVVWMVLSVKGVVKAFDYSLFRAAKEILYIPLSRIEKTQGKGVIDILVYRFSKGGSSVLLMMIVFFGMTQYLMYIIFSLMAVWFFLTFVIAKRYRSVVSFEDEVFMHKN